MKGYSRRKAAALLFLFCMLPWFTAAQTRTEEEVSTGRFGAEEPEDPGTAAEKGLDTEWLYLGLRTGPSFRFYTPADDTRFTGGDTSAVSIDLAFQVNVKVLSFLSIQAEMVFTWDSVSLWAYSSGSMADRYTRDYTGFSLQFPLIVQFDFYPGRFRISPFLGTYFLVPLGKLQTGNSLNGESQSLNYKFSPPVGFLGGLNGAVKFGPGAVIADIRYAADLGNLEAAEGKIQEFKRGMISLTVGYEFGFFTKKRGNP